MTQQTNLFTTARFLPLFIAQFFGAFNDNAFKNALLVWITYHVGSSYHGIDASAMVSLASGIFILPFFLFSAIAGQMADKYEKAWLTRHIKLIEVALMIVCGSCFLLKSVSGLLIVLFLMGVQSTFFGPIKYSLLPEHLHEQELVSGNAWIEGGTFLSILLGTVFGGIVMALPFWGPYILAFCLVLFSVVGYVSSRYIPTSPISDKNVQLNWHILRETKNIMGYARQNTCVWHAVLGISWFWFIGIIFLSLFPLYTSSILGGNELLVTFFITLFSLGIGMGSFICNSMLKGSISAKFMIKAALGISFSIFLLCIASLLYTQQCHSIPLETPTNMGLYAFFTNNIWSVIISLSIFTLSICGGIYIVPLYAIMQHYADKKYLSRIVAGNNILNAFFMVCASLLTLVLFALDMSTIEIFFIVAIINLSIHIYIAFCKRGV